MMSIVDRDQRIIGLCTAVYNYYHNKYSTQANKLELLLLSNMYTLFLSYIFSEIPLWAICYLNNAFKACYNNNLIENSMICEYMSDSIHAFNIKTILITTSLNPMHQLYSIEHTCCRLNFQVIKNFRVSIVFCLHVSTKMRMFHCR